MKASSCPRALRGGFRAGDPIPYLDRNLPSGLFHASASLGIAEAAFARVASPKRVNGDARATMLVADSAVDLAAARGVISRAASLIDEHFAAHPADSGADEQITSVFSEGQAAKTFVSEAATCVREPSCIRSAPTARTRSWPARRSA